MFNCRQALNPTVFQAQALLHNRNQTVSMLSVTGAFADAHGAADFLGDDDPSKVVDSSDNTCGFHKYLSP